MNAISITRSAELSNPDLASKIELMAIPKGPHGRLGLEHVMGIYVIWKFSQNKTAAKKFLVDAQTRYGPHFTNSGFYNFPAFPGGVKGGFKSIRKATAADKHKPLGKYTILTTIAERYTTNVGHPGYSNAAIDEVFNKFLLPQMFAEVAQDKMSPDEAVKAAEREIKAIFSKWRRRKKL